MASIRHWLVSVLLCLLASKCTPHLSTDFLKEIAFKEQSIFKQIRDYHQARTRELESLQRKIEHIQKDHKEASGDLEVFLGNPLNAYRLIKRLVIDWNWIHAFITNANTTQNFIDKWTSDMDRMRLPSESDLQEAIGSLINANDAIDGAGAEIIYGQHMEWDECYEVAVNLFDAENFLEALHWFKVALEKLKNEEIEFSEDFQADIVEYIAFSKYLLGNVPGAYSTLKGLENGSVASPNLEEVKTYLILNGNSFSFKRVTRHGEPHSIRV